MNNKIRKKLIKEFNKYNLDKNILDNYNFEIINKKFVYIKDNKKYNFIEIDDNVVIDTRNLEYLKKI